MAVTEYVSKNKLNTDTPHQTDKMVQDHIFEWRKL
jgi:hypothetical protein